jgi:hypothetical protein
MTPSEYISAIEEAERQGDEARVRELCDAFDAAYPKDYYRFCEEDFA